MAFPEIIREVRITIRSSGRFAAQPAAELKR
jgi:hypothetical protein